MKRLFIALLLATGAMSMVVADVEAKRMGGGGSFGRQSQSVNRAAPTQSSQATNAAKSPSPAAAPGATAPKPASPWRGILGGALLGLGLGALLSHLGIGGALASMISTILMVALFALAAMFIYRMIMRRKNGNNGGNAAEPAFAGGYSARNTTPEIGSRLEPYSHQPAALQADAATAAGSAAVATAPWGVPADFDAPAFLRNAKTYFIRLQAAWDRGNTNDIREFTTPEMYAELKMQIQERGATSNNTDVMSLEAELLGVETLETEHLASVKFTGMIKESENASAEPFAEVWNLVKPVSGNGGWILAGIQQLP
jgi:predicted lipid-binding transport protein (Tim44 family)